MNGTYEHSVERCHYDDRCVKFTRRILVSSTNVIVIMTKIILFSSTKIFVFVVVDIKTLHYMGENIGSKVEN